MHSMWFHGSPDWYILVQTGSFPVPSEHGGMIPEAVHAMEFHLIPSSASAQHYHTPSAMQPSHTLVSPLVKMA